MEIQQYNAEVSAWSRNTNRKVKLEIARLILKTSTGTAQSMQKSAVTKYGGEASKISFSFPYYMVFVHKGAGRGYGGSITKQFSNAKGGKTKTNTNSLGKMGTGKRKAKPFFNPVVEDAFPILADIIGTYHGDKVIAKIQKILIR
jgi:hypothetical protein